MNNSRVIGLAAVSLMLSLPAFGQGFVNLTFEQATIAPTPVGGWTYPADPSQCFPGWTVGYGVVMYNDLSLGSPATVLMGPSFPNFVNYTPLQGSYSVLLQYFGYAGPAPSLSQTGLLPASAQSVSILVASGTSSTAAVVTMNGVSIPLFAESGSRLAGDISAFAGTSAQLTISTPSSGGWLYFDDVQFSSSSVPEPRALSLLMPSILVLCCRRARSNKTVQATPMNAAVLPLRSQAGLCHRYGVPDLFR